MIDAKAAYPAFETWLNGVCAREKPGPGIIAFNFGVFEGEAGYMTYLVGSKEYDEADSDWACNEDFVPKDKYFELPDSTGDDWQHIQSAVEELVRQFMTTPAYEQSFLSRAQVITVGFDDGDLTRVK